MAKPQIFSMFPERATAPIMPPQFDAAMIRAFFAGDQTDRVLDTPKASLAKAKVALQQADELSMSALADKAQPLDNDWLHGKPDLAHDHELPDHQHPEADNVDPEVRVNNAPSALQEADTKANADLTDLARPLDEDWWSHFTHGASHGTDQQPQEVEEPEFFDSADVKPTSGGKGGGRGMGKGHDKTPAEPAPTDPIANDPVATDPEPTDPAPTDPVTEPTTGETNPGTTSGNTYISGMDTPDGYNIELVFHGDWTDAMKLGFINAAEDISDIITGDVSNFNGIDDFRLNLYSGSIDGGGGTLANAGWMSLRDGPDKLVAEGGVRIDSADLQMMIDKGIYEDMAFHETLHAMGFGTTWAYTGLTEESADGTRFVGANAIEAYHDSYPDLAASDPLSAKGVPLSGDDSHWKQSLLGKEIMSPSLNFSDNILSDLTIAALEDMGYETTYGDEEEEPLMMM